MTCPHDPLPTQTDGQTHSELNFLCCSPNRRFAEDHPSPPPFLHPPLFTVLYAVTRSTAVRNRGGRSSTYVSAWRGRLRDSTCSGRLAVASSCRHCRVLGLVGRLANRLSDTCRSSLPMPLPVRPSPAFPPCRLLTLTTFWESSIASAEGPGIVARADR